MYISKLQSIYSTLDEWSYYAEMYNLHQRLGFDSIEEAWAVNPTVQGSCNPSDYRVVYPVVKTQDSSRD